MGSSERPSPARRVPPPAEPEFTLPLPGRGTGSGGATHPGPTADFPWTTFSTRSVAEARHFVTNTFQGRDVQVGGDPETFEFTVHTRRMDLFRVDVLQHTGTLEMVSGRGDHVLAAHVFRGELAVELESGRLSVHPGEAILTTVDEPRAVAWTDLGTVVVQLDTYEFRRLAAELTGAESMAQRLHVEKATPAGAQLWSAAVRYVINGFLDNPVAVSVVAMRESFRLLTLAALEAFPQPEFSLVDSPDTVILPPATVRRAMEFIEANAERHVTVGEIAQFARLSRRGLQSAFQRHLGTTPSAYLRDVRLARAHQELFAGDRKAGASVAEIAERWGFVHQGRFAAAYRKKFGEPPSQTLSS